MKLIILFNFLFFFNINYIYSRPFSTAIGEGQIQISKQIPKNIFLNKRIKYFSNNEKAFLVDKHNKELAIVDFCCGGYMEVQRISVTSLTKERNNKLNLTTISSFKTNAGVYLGLNKKQIIRLLGNPDSIITKNKKEILIYQIEDDKNSFLEKYNMPSYYEKYIFEKNILIKYDFGFDYP